MISYGKKIICTLIVICIVLFNACSQNEDSVASKGDATVEKEDVSFNTVEEAETENKEEEAENIKYDGPRELVLYFGNWKLDSQGAMGEVAGLPWDKITTINHSFWKIQPNDKGEYKIVSTLPEADLLNQSPSEWDIGTELPKNHFAQYEYYSTLYPNVDILIAIGGWNCNGYFSEMALTKESRRTFIDSCIDLMKEYTWIDGIDIDWEYPGCFRLPESEEDEGCPVVGTDRENYTALLKEMREAFDEEFGKNEKKLTVCLSVSSRSLLNQDIQEFHQYVDLINVMAYDINGAWSGVTGHQAYIYGGGGADTIIQFLHKIGVPGEKIILGTAFFERGWGGIEPNENGEVMGQRTVRVSIDNISWAQLKLLELQAVEVGTPGFHLGYDKEAIAAYLWNDDPNSKLYQCVLSYDNEYTIPEKAKYIEKEGLGGMMIWASYHDCVQDGLPLTSLASKSLGIYDGEIPVYTGNGVEDVGLNYNPENYK